MNFSFIADCTTPPPQERKKYFYPYHIPIKWTHMFLTIVNFIEKIHYKITDNHQEVKGQWTEHKSSKILSMNMCFCSSKGWEIALGYNLIFSPNNYGLEED